METDLKSKSPAGKQGLSESRCKDNNKSLNNKILQALYCKGGVLC